MRILTCCAAVLASALLGSVPDLSAQSRRPLLDAVRHFQSVWGADISYASNTLQDRYTVWTEPVATSAETDIKHLLDGTGVTFFQQSSGTFFLKPLEARVSTLLGSVRSKETGAPLRGAHIALVGTEEGTTSDLQGRFILSTAPRNPAEIRVSYVGFLPEHLEVELLADSIVAVDVSLSEWVLEERPLEITASPLLGELPFLISDRPYAMDIRIAKDLRQVIGLGTPDIVRSLSDVAGLYIDLSTSDIHIQGSGLGEHQFKLDGSTVFEPIHLGLFGIFNPFAIDKITVRKAGFDAEYGSYLAGIISAEHSLTSDRAIEVQIDPISLNTRITNQMNLRGTTLSVMGAFRTSIWDHWWSNLRSESVNDLLREWNRPDEFLMLASIYPLKQAFEDGYNNLVSRLQKVPLPSLPNIGFNDLHAATKIDFGYGKEAGASVYAGNSDLEGRLLSAPKDEEEVRKSISPDRHTWTNRSVRLYWQQPLTGNLDWRISWRRGKYLLSHNYGGLDRQNSVHAAFNQYRYNSIETSDENGISSNDLDLSISHGNSYGVLRAGLDFSWMQHHFRIQHVFPRVLDHERNSLIASGYLQQIWAPAPWMELTTGFRFTRLRAQGKWHMEPRTALLFKSPYKDGYGVSLRLATGIYYQFINQFEIATISPSTIVPSTRFWLPVDETLPAPLSNHYSIDLSAQLWTNWQLGLEYYYKDQRSVYSIDYPLLWQQEVDSTETINRIDQFVRETDGYVYGTSMELRRNGEKVQLGIRFERSESIWEYTFRGNKAKMLPVPWNVPQQFQIRATVRPVSALEGTMRWHGAWGRKWAFKRAYYDLLGSDIDYATRFQEYSFEDPTADGHALAPFSQLDLGVALILRDRSDRRFQVRLDVLNALGRQNPAYRYLLERGQPGSDKKVLTDQTSYLIGRTLTISAQFQW